LREKGWNRIGNLIVPNENYCYFEDWLQPLLNECLDKQKNEGIHWTPSKLINYLGSRCENESSLYYWCFKNHIPVFSPALTDGSLGDNLYFQSYKNHVTK
jgi:deoxyhypusine synthase